MAKLKAPLLSLGASGQLGKVAVFFPWKGIDSVREYVIPANPRTIAQTTQRGYIKDAVSLIHSEQARADNPIDQDDIMAYSQLALALGITMTWFNTIVRQWVLQQVAGLKGAIFRNGTTTPGTDELAVSVFCSDVVPTGITTLDFYYGTSRTALVNKESGAPNVETGEVTATLSNLTTGVKYFWQCRAVTEAYFGCRSGIYYGVPL